eukprot:NODE_525_length_6489_cov_0.356338.p3 type:complete len:270 gc:universal NODE_525_length_6489_cov_0.356338:2006-1197(-)
MLWNLLIFGHVCVDVTEQYEKPESKNDENYGIDVGTIDEIYSCSKDESSVQSTQEFELEKDGFEFLQIVFDESKIDWIAKNVKQQYIFYNSFTQTIAYSKYLESFVKSKYKKDVFCTDVLTFKKSKLTESKMHVDKVELNDLTLMSLLPILQRKYKSSLDLLKRYFAIARPTIQFWINLEEEIIDHPLALVSKRGPNNRAYLFDKMKKGEVIAFYGGETVHGALKRVPNTDFERKSVSFTCIEADEFEMAIIRNHQSTKVEQYTFQEEK